LDDDIKRNRRNRYIRQSNPVTYSKTLYNKFSSCNFLYVIYNLYDISHLGYGDRRPERTAGVDEPRDCDKKFQRELVAMPVVVVVPVAVVVVVVEIEIDELVQE
jgi:hypothetical protein